MGAGQSEEEIRNELLNYLENDGEYSAPGSEGKTLMQALKDRIMIGKDILKDPSLGKVLPNAGKAMLMQAKEYMGNISSNSKLRKQRSVMKDLVRQKLENKAKATGRSIDDLEDELDDIESEKLKWDNHDWMNAAYGGPWGLIASGVRHKRQNDVNKLIAQYRKLKSEGYGKFGLLKNKKRKMYKGPMNLRLKQAVWRSIS